MIMTNKLLPVALIAALVGGSVGALVMHKSQPAEAETTTAASQNAAPTAEPVAYNNEMVQAQFNTAGEQTAYKTGFADGYSAATEGTQSTVVTKRVPSRVVYRSGRA